jgi:hypothetical protein
VRRVRKTSSRPAAKEGILPSIRTLSDLTFCMRVLPCIIPT